MISSKDVQESIFYITSTAFQLVHLSQCETQAYSIHAHNARVDVFFDELCPVAICNQSGFCSQIKLDVKDKLIWYLLIGIWKFLPFSQNPKTLELVQLCQLLPDGVLPLTGVCVVCVGECQLAFGTWPYLRLVDD